jgi:hypothetical protein
MIVAKLTAADIERPTNFVSDDQEPDDNEQEQEEQEEVSVDHCQVLE